MRHPERQRSKGAHGLQFGILRLVFRLRMTRILTIFIKGKKKTMKNLDVSELDLKNGCLTCGNFSVTSKKIGFPDFIGNRNWNGFAFPKDTHTGEIFYLFWLKIGIDYTLQLVYRENTGKMELLDTNHYWDVAKFRELIAIFKIAEGEK